MSRKDEGKPEIDKIAGGATPNLWPTGWRALRPSQPLQRSR